MHIFGYGISTLAYGMGEMLWGLISIIPKVAYILANSFLGIIDVFQLLFRKLAGLDVYYVAGEPQTGDIVYEFIRGTLMGDYPIISTVFWGLIILGVILLFLSTIISIIRNEYTTEKDGNSKGKIIGNSFKAIFYFAIIPIVCIFGVYLANVVLVAVDKATTPTSASSTILNTSLLEPYDVYTQTFGTVSSGDEESNVGVEKTYTGYNVFGFNTLGTSTTTFSGLIFKASAYSCNRVRLTENSIVYANGVEYQGYFELLQEGIATNFNGLFTDAGNDAEMVALYIDTAFADSVKLKSGTVVQLVYPEGTILNSNAWEWDPIGSQQDDYHDFVNRFNATLVWYYYDLWQFNLIIAFGAAIIMVTIFTNIIFGLMRRIIELVGMFLISAPLIALMPLDEGGAYKKWRDNFLKTTLMAYGAVGGMNILFLILPELQKIRFFNIYFVDILINTIIVIVGLLTVKRFIELISGFVGGDNAESVGGGIAKDAGSTLAKAGMMAAGSLGAPAMLLGAPARLGAKAAGAGIGAAKSRVLAKWKLPVEKAKWDSEKFGKEEAEREKIEAGRGDIEKEVKDNKMVSDSDVMTQANKDYNMSKFATDPNGYGDALKKSREKLEKEKAQSIIDQRKANVKVDMPPEPTKDAMVTHPIRNVRENKLDTLKSAAFTSFVPTLSSLNSLKGNMLDPLKGTEFFKTLNGEDKGENFLTKFKSTFTAENPKEKKKQEEREALEKKILEEYNIRKKLGITE